MEQLTKNQAVATSQEAVQNQNEPQLRDENAHNDKSVHGVLNPTYQAGLRRRSEERFSRNAETDLVCRLLLEKKKFGSQCVLLPNALYCSVDATWLAEIYTLSLHDALPISKEWNNSLKTKLSLLPKKLFRIRMSRNFGMKMLTMTNLSTECLIQLTKLGYD